MQANEFPQVPGYESLTSVLARAHLQASLGKGKDRHACGRPFTEQPMQVISDLLDSDVGLLYQAIKKIQESRRLDKDAAVRELLGAIVYIAGAVIHMEKHQPELPLQVYVDANLPKAAGDDANLPLTSKMQYRAD